MIAPPDLRDQPGIDLKPCTVCMYGTVSLSALQDSLVIYSFSISCHHHHKETPDKRSSCPSYKVNIQKHQEAPKAHPQPTPLEPRPTAMAAAAVSTPRMASMPMVVVMMVMAASMTVAMTMVRMMVMFLFLILPIMYLVSNIITQQRTTNGS